MSCAAFVNLLSVVVGFIAALFFCVGSALLTRKSIGELAGSYWNENPHFAAFLRSTKAEYFCGGIALCFTFALQFLALVLDLFPDQLLFRNTAVGISVAVMLGVFFGLLLVGLRRYLRVQLAAPEVT